MKLLHRIIVKAFNYDGRQYQLIKSVTCQSTADSEFQIRLFEGQDYDLVTAETDSESEESRSRVHYV